MKIKLRILLIFLTIIIIPSIILCFNIMNKKNYEMDNFFLTTLSIIIGIIFILVYWIHFRVLDPIMKLHEAIIKIKNGNLDFKLNFETYDEIDELAQDFEEMRMKLKQNEEQKVLQAKNNKEMISNIVHDLKTPITAIKAYIEGLIDNVASSPEMKDKYIRTIYNKANDMDTIIEELNFYAKIENDNIQYNYKKLDILEFFKDCVSEIKQDMQTLGIDFKFINNIKNKTYIIVDAEQMKRVVTNITSNAIKHMNKSEAKICIHLIDECDFVKIEISDNGTGISSEDLPYIFDRFYQSKASKKLEGKGSGIGLSIVKKIVEDHGGRVWAKSILGSSTSVIILLKKYQEGVNNE